MKMTVILAAAAIFPVYYLIKYILRKFDIPRATASRAKILNKRIYDGPNYAAHLIAPKAANPVYFITFAYMIDNNWTEKEFNISKKIFNSFHEGNEGILKHNYEEFRNFEIFTQ